MRVTRHGTWWLAAFLGAALAGAQTPPQSSPSSAATKKEEKKPPAKKAKKVWTDDDVKSLRRPSDEYEEQKLAAQQAAAAAKAAEAKEAEEEGNPAPGATIDPKTGKPLEDPDSAKALQREVIKWEDELRRNQQLAEEARREFLEATDGDRRELAQKKQEIYEQNIIDIRKHLADLRVQLEKAKKQKAPGSPAPAALQQPPSAPGASPPQS